MRRVAVAVSVGVLVLGLGACGDGSGLPDGRFVSADGSRLVLGETPFVFVGVNAWSAASDPAIFDCSGSAMKPDFDHQAHLDQMFSDLERLGANAVRFFAFQSYAGGGSDLSPIRRVIETAAKHDIRVIPVLGNHYADCDYYPSYSVDSGFTKDTAWYASGYKRPYSGYSMSYRDYVASVVDEFKDDPTILMWQLVNEAQTSTHSDGAQLRAFAADVAGLVKSIDANHLVSIGTQGTGQPGIAGPDYRALHEISTIDVVEAHDYSEQAEPLPGFPDCRWNCVWASLVDARDLGKPFFIGEAGIEAGDAAVCALDREQRADYLGAKVSALFREGGVGYLLWDYSEGTAGKPCDYALGPGDPAMRRMRSLVQAMADRDPS